MESIIMFFYVLAWIFGVINAGMIILKTLGAWRRDHTTIGKIEELQYNLKGLRSTYDWRKNAVILIICVAYIIVI